MAEVAVAFEIMIRRVQNEHSALRRGSFEELKFY